MLGTNARDSISFQDNPRIRYITEGGGEILSGFTAITKIPSNGGLRRRRPAGAHGVGEFAQQH